MPWTATINYIGAPGDTTEVSVIATDGVRKQQFRYQTDGTLAFLRPLVLRSLAALDTQVVKTDLVLGQAIDTTPIVPTTPVDPDPARTQFLVDVRLLQSMHRAIDVGLMSVSDKTYTDQQSKTLSEFQAAYLGLV